VRPNRVQDRYRGAGHPFPRDPSRGPHPWDDSTVPLGFRSSPDCPRHHPMMPSSLTGRRPFGPGSVERARSKEHQRPIWSRCGGTTHSTATGPEFVHCHGINPFVRALRSCRCRPIVAFLGSAAFRGVGDACNTRSHTQIRSCHQLTRGRPCPRSHPPGSIAHPCQHPCQHNPLCSRRAASMPGDGPLRGPGSNGHSGTNISFQSRPAFPDVSLGGPIQPRVIALLPCVQFLESGFPISAVPDFQMIARSD
jgi:hypothetical protein